MGSLEKLRSVLTKNRTVLKDRFKVKKIGVFGSFVRGEEGRDSDVDILVDLSEPIGWEFVDLKEFLEEILGFEVDLVTVKFTAGMDYSDFSRNEMVIDAVLRNIEVIGEAAKNIPDDIKDKYTEIPWKRIIGLRNIVIHEYHGVDLENIWKIVNENIPSVRPVFEKIREEVE
jgi:uncharacterized protein with HEPN domain